MRAFKPRYPGAVYCASPTYPGALGAFENEHSGFRNEHPDPARILIRSGLDVPSAGGWALEKWWVHKYKTFIYNMICRSVDSRINRIIDLFVFVGELAR